MKTAVLSYTLGADGQPRSPLTAEELGAVLAPLLPSTLVHQVTLDLSAPLADLPVAPGVLGIIQTVVVRALTGSAALKFGGPTATPIPLEAGQVRDRLAVSSLLLSCPGAAGAALTLELHGRP
jgi:hypothetical protein